MKCRLGNFAALAMLLLAARAGAVEWVTDLEAARTAAKAANQIVLVDYWADWCGPCQRMDVEAWTHPRIRQLAGRYTCARVDFGPRGNSTTQYYNVNGIPTVTMLDAKGGIVLRMMGYRNAIGLEMALQSLPTRNSELDSLLASAAKPPADAAAAVSLADSLARRGLLEPGASLCKRLLKNPAVQQDDALSQQVELLAAVCASQAQPDKGLAGLKSWLDRYPGSPVRPRAHSELVRTLVMLGAKKDAEAALADMRTALPDDPLTRAAGDWVALMR